MSLFTPSLKPPICKIKKNENFVRLMDADSRKQGCQLEGDIPRPEKSAMTVKNSPSKIVRDKCLKVSVFEND